MGGETGRFGGELAGHAFAAALAEDVVLPVGQVRRVMPLLEKLRAATDAFLSVDTGDAEVIRRSPMKVPGGKSTRYSVSG